jgi:diguanylate cyclase (GGDEF)-like protein/PAS domain S-box-containing protein
VAERRLVDVAREAERDGVAGAKREPMTGTEQGDPGSRTPGSADAIPPAARMLGPMRVLAMVIAAVFVTEFAIMFLLAELPSMPLHVTALVDAGFLSIVIAPLMLLLIYRPMRVHLEARERAIRMVRESEKRFSDIAANAKEWIWEVDRDGRYVYSSQVVEDVLGYTSDEVLGHHFYDLFHPEDRETLKRDALDAFARKQPFRDFLNRNVHKDGSSVWLSTSGVPIVDAAGNLLGYRGADVVKYSESALKDGLTGLLNREGFQLLAEHQLRSSERTGHPVTVLFADLDNLKPINDRFGHAAGDRAIAHVARALANAVRRSDVVARLGGDEFAVLLVGSGTPAGNETVIGHVRARLEALEAGSDLGFPLSVSLGMASQDASDPRSLDELLVAADTVMYREKRDKQEHGAATRAS